ncbi:hypothetical protein, partial [Spiroplasma endosymbiont of Amphibalanus improvisus]|uniref:hypothetical protein n=1 Tax=Spiroplasma endosymbiont of Amphibalanus improvisus TaxID=3066327 RepID=UPI00313D3B09
NINSFDQTKIIDNPNNPNNSLDPQNQTYLTADQVNQNCLVSLLYLPVSDKDQDGTYDFNLQSIIQMINDSDMTLDEFIKIIQDIENGNTQEFLKLISEMPELMDMNALPFMATQPIYTYSTASSPIVPVLFHLSGTGQKYSLDPSTNKGTSDINPDSGAFNMTMMNFWNGVLLHPYSNLETLDPRYKIVISLSVSELKNTKNINDFYNYVNNKIINKIYTCLTDMWESPKLQPRFKDDLPPTFQEFKQHWNNVYKYNTNPEISSDTGNPLPWFHFYDNEHSANNMDPVNNFEWLQTWSSASVQQIQQNVPTLNVYYSCRTDNGAASPRYNQLILNFRIVWGQ